MIGEGPSGHIDHHLLHDQIAATRIAPLSAGNLIHADWWGIRGPLPIKDLQQRREPRTDLVAGKLGTVRPALWLSISRSVTGCFFAKRLSGMRQLLSFRLMSSSSDIRPCSTKCSAPRAATGLLTEAA